MDELRTVFRRLGQEPDPAALDRLREHHRLLRAWNGRAHLVSEADASPGGLIRHDLESLQALPFLRGRRRVADIGTGGGYPALAWACVEPALPVVLVESSSRKAAFLREARRILDLPEVEVLPRRIESAAGMLALAADLWTTRAAGCASLLVGASRSVQPGGTRLILYPGAAEADELGASAELAAGTISSESLASGASGRLLVIDI